MTILKSNQMWGSARRLSVVLFVTHAFQTLQRRSKEWSYKCFGVIRLELPLSTFVCVPTLISFICLVPRAGRNGGWRNLCSSIYFMDKPLKSCVDVIHTGIVDIWNLNDTNRVSPPHFPNF
jgi:hypothetical protein